MSDLRWDSTWTDWLDVPLAFWCLCMSFGFVVGLSLGVLR